MFVTINIYFVSVISCVSYVSETVVAGANTVPGALIFDADIPSLLSLRLRSFNSRFTDVSFFLSFLLARTGDFFLSFMVYEHAFFAQNSGMLTKPWRSFLPGYLNT